MLNIRRMFKHVLCIFMHKHKDAHTAAAQSAARRAPTSVALALSSAARAAAQRVDPRIEHRVNAALNPHELGDGSRALMSQTRAPECVQPPLPSPSARPSKRPPARRRTISTRASCFLELQPLLVAHAHVGYLHILARRTPARTAQVSLYTAADKQRTLRMLHYYSDV